MNPGSVRRALHAVHAGSSVVLIASGALIHWPELRLRLLGGYGLTLASVHEWASLAFAGAPLALLALALRPILRDLGARLGPPDGPTWRKIHIVLTLALSALLSLSGLGLWQQQRLSADAADLALDAHVWLSWAIAISLPIHLFAARRKIAEIAAIRLGLRPAPEDDPFFDDP